MKNHVLSERDISALSLAEQGQKVRRHIFELQTQFNDDGLTQLDKKIEVKIKKCLKRGQLLNKEVLIRNGHLSFVDFIRKNTPQQIGHRFSQVELIKYLLIEEAIQLHIALAKEPTGFNKK